MLGSSIGAAQATDHVYDGDGRLVAETNAAGASAKYVYDAIGNLVRIDRLTSDKVAVFAFSPGRGGPGAQVTIQGQGFSTTAASNTVKFNGTAAMVASATATRLVASVPASATSGLVSVTVGAQTASSADVFTVDPEARPPAITGVSPLLVSVGASVTVSGSYFAPGTGQTSIALNGRSVLPATLTNAQAVFAVPDSTSGGKVSVATPYGVAIGTQDVVVVPPGLVPSDVASTGRLVIDGAAVAGSVPVNKSALLLFDATASALLSLQFTNLTGPVTYSILGPDNRLIETSTVTRTTPTIHLPRLPSTATYTLALKPQAAAASWSVNLERDKVLPIGGNTLTVPTTAVNQSKRFTFVVESGANLGLGVRDLVFPSGSGQATVSVYRADGNDLYGNDSENGPCYASRKGCALDLPNLSAGLYTATVEPSGTDLTMSFKATLSADVTGILQPNAVLNLNVARPGQNARLTFAATTGQTVALNVANPVTVPSGAYTYYTVYRPDGSELTLTYATAGLTLNLQNLPATGTYTVFVNPYEGETLTAQMKLVPGVTTTLAVGGASSSLATTTPGQNIYLTFTATAGANLGLGLSELITSDNGFVAVSLARADGTYVNGGGSCYGSFATCGIDLANLAAGTYIAKVAPSSSSQTMRFKATLSADLTGTLTSNTAFNLNLARPGQNGRLTFSGTAGQAVALSVAGQTTVPANGYAYYTIYRPDGVELTSTYTTAGQTMNLQSLPVTGTYSVVVNPFYGETLVAQLKLASGVTGTLTVNGSTTSYSTTTPGQNIYLMFTAAAGANLGLGLSDVLISGNGSASVSLTRADGSYVTGSSCSGAICGIDFVNLAAGTYVATVTPFGSSQMTFKATLSADISGTLAPNTAFNLNLARPGQNGRLTFSGTAGQSVALSIVSQTTMPSGGYAYYTIYRPDGVELTSTYTTTGQTMNLQSLPATGTYTVVVNPYYGETLTAQLKLVSGVTGTSTVGGAVASHATTTPGQNIYLTFTAAAGANLGLGLSDLVTSDNGAVTVGLARADGTYVNGGGSCYGSFATCGIDLANLAAGTYIATIAPSSSSQTMRFKATLSADLTGTLTLNTTFNLNLARPGQNGRLTFSGTAGQPATLTVSNQAMVPSGRYAYYTVYRPDGTYLTSSYTTANLTFNLGSLPATGTYTLVVNPNYGETLTAQLKLVPQ